MSEEVETPPKGRRSAVQAEGRCVCGAFYIDVDVTIPLRMALAHPDGSAFEFVPARFDHSAPLSWRRMAKPNRKGSGGVSNDALAPGHPAVSVDGNKL